MNKLRLDAFLNMGYTLTHGDFVTKLPGGVVKITGNNKTIYNKVNHYGIERRFVHSLCELDINEITKTQNVSVKSQDAPKPRTKTEYVKVEFKSFAEAFSKMRGEGGRYYVGNESESNDYRPESDSFLADVCLNSLMIDYNNLYRKVETEIKTEKRWIGVTTEGERFRNTELSYVSIDELKKNVCAPYGFDDFQFIEITVEL